MVDIKDWPSPDKEKMFSYLSYNGFRSDKHKLFYVATPKVACTSLKWWFADLEECSQNLRGITDSPESSPDLVIHDAFKKVAPNVIGLIPEALSETLTSDLYFRFAVVRNPYSRIFSAWQSKLLLQEPLQIGPYLKCDFFHYTIECANDIAAAFEGFLEHLAANEIPFYWDDHWTPQVTLLRPDLINYSKLAKIEDTSELGQALAERLGPKFVDPFAIRHTNESLIPYLPELVTDRSSELIRSLYAIDFETFGYSKQPPEAKETFSANQFDLALKAITFIRSRHQRLGERTKQIANLNQAVSERDGQISSFNQIVAERDGQVASLNQTVAERDGQVAGLNGQVANLVAEQNSLLNSMSWKITKPLRYVHSGLVYVRSGLVNKLRQSPHTDISSHKGNLGLELSAEFSQLDTLWIEKMLSHSNEVVSVLHPNWLGIKSSNQEMFDNSYYIDDSVTEASARYYCHLFQAAGIRKLVIQGFPLSYSHFIDTLRKDAPQISIYAIWHGSFMQSGEDVNWRAFQALLTYARNGQIAKIGFVKEGMAEVLNKYGARTGFVMNLVQRIPDAPSFPITEVGNSKLGLWNTNGSAWRKLPFAMIAAAGTVSGCTLHISGADKRIRAFTSLLGVQNVVSDTPILQPEMPLRLAEMHLNLYVTLSECAPMLPLESLSVGVPCLFGPNSHYFRDNQFLHSRLVVPYPDSAHMIAKYIERALEERSEIIREYIRYAPDYNVRAKQTLINFLDM